MENKKVSNYKTEKSAGKSGAFFIRVNFRGYFFELRARSLSKSSFRLLQYR